MQNVFSLEHVEGYNGCGYALAAIADGKVVEIAYIRDIDPSLDTLDRAIDEMTPPYAAIEVSGSPKCKQRGEFFEERGFSQVAFGMVSAWEFNLL